MRADRLVSLLLLLQNRGRMTAPELAVELEVSVRTVYRDVEALSASGIPVRADRGPAGGYCLAEGYRTRLTGLTGHEAQALPFVGAAGPAQDLGLGAVQATAQLKLHAALPPELAERTRRIQDRFHLDAPAWFRDADPVPYLAPIARAVWDQYVLRVHYRGWARETRSELQPLGIVLKGGIWYLIALAAETPRTFRVSRFLAADATGEQFERPPGFDLAAHWQDATRRLETGRFKAMAHLRVSPQGQRLLPMYYGAPGAQALEQAGPPGPDGWVEIKLPVEGQTMAIGDLLRLGGEVEVLAPPELRHAIGQTAAQLAMRHAVPSSEVQPSPHHATVEKRSSADTCSHCQLP